MKIKRNTVIIIIGILLALLLLYYFRGILGYVLGAWVVSLAGRPMTRFLQNQIKLGKWRMGATTSATITLLTFLLAALLIVALFIPMIIDQIDNFASVDYKKIVTSLNEPIESVNKRLDKIGSPPISRSQFEDQLRNSFSGWFKLDDIGKGLNSFFSALGTVFISIFSVIFIAFFFLKEKDLFAQAVIAAAPNQHETQVSNIVNDISSLLTRYFAGIALQISIITLFVTVALSIIGVEYALLIGFFAALVNLIPYLGPLIGGIFGVFIAISSNLEVDFYTGMLPLILKIAAVFAMVQLLDNFVLQPYIFSNSVKAHPLEIFIVILMGSQIGGILGMVLAIPTYTVLRVIARSFLSEFKIVQRLTGRLDET